MLLFYYYWFRSLLNRSVLDLEMKSEYMQNETNNLLFLEVKCDGKKTRGRPRVSWSDEWRYVQWTQMKRCDEINDPGQGHIEKNDTAIV